MGCLLCQPKTTEELSEERINNSLGFVACVFLGSVHRSVITDSH